MAKQPMPWWYPVLDDLRHDDSAPDEVRRACRDALVYVDRMREALHRELERAAAP